MSVVSPLERLGEPLFHRLDAEGWPGPPDRLDRSQRTYVRTLEGMQKEAVIVGDDGQAWRLASDEGDYLDGDDIAPCPLSFFSTGLIASVLNRVETLAGDRGLPDATSQAVVDCFYTMKGSALRGDMTGGALDPEFSFEFTGDVDEAEMTDLVEEAVATAPVMGLVREPQESLFTLTLNGEELDPDRVRAIDAAPVDDPADRFDALAYDAPPQEDPLVRHTGEMTGEFPGDRERYTAGEGSSLQEEQDRILHLRGECTRGDDGIKRIRHHLYSPQGSIFEVRSDETPRRGGSGRAPPALAYAAAGIGFCFMTQFGRYAGITDKQLDAYRIVQDMHFGEDAEASPVETHVFLESPEGEDFARDILDMSEQTCFLHALCRSALTPTVDVTVS